MSDYKLVPVELIELAAIALERFANDTLVGRNVAHELRELLAANKRYHCNAVQFSDQMSCSCGNVWDMNDPYPPECKKEPTMATNKPVETIRRAIDALERFANDTLAGRNSAHELRELLAAAPAVQGDLMLHGFRVMHLVGRPGVRKGERWEIYAPCGSGGVVHEDEVADWVVRKLLDSLATSKLEDQREPAGFIRHVHYHGIARNSEECEVVLYDNAKNLPEGTLLYAAPPPAEQQLDPHPDDAAVDRFAAAMKAKLNKKRQEGRGGWQSMTAEQLSALLHEHVRKGDPVDVANLAMMLHQNGQRIEQQPSPDTLIGRTVSMDVSTGDHNAFHRLFGIVTGVEGRDGVILCELTEDNQDTQPAPDVSELVEALERISKRASVAESKQVPGSYIQRLFVDIMQQADDALAAHRKQGVKP